MSEDTGPRPPRPDGVPPTPPTAAPGPWFRDELARPTTDNAPTAVHRPGSAPASSRPFPPLQRSDPQAPYGRMPPVAPDRARPPTPGRRPGPAGPPSGRDGYPAQPPPQPLTPRRDPEPPRSAPPRPPRRPRRRRRFGARRVLVLLLVLGLVLPAALYLFADTRLERVDAFPAASTRPPDTPGTNWLIVGSDSREGLSAEERRRLRTGTATGQRTDTMMLLHISAAGNGPTLVSLPRDSYVPIPGHSANRLNAAFAFGGPQLLVQTIEALTRIRIDHYAEIGFAGLFDLVNAVGGVDMCIDEAKRDPKAGLNIAKGCQTLDGAQALGVARSRASTRGDLDRVGNQRELISALMDKVASPSTLLNPFRLWSVATKGAGALAVDSSDHLLDLARLAWAAKSLGSGGTTTTVPISSSFSVAGVGDVVGWDETRSAALFKALRQDKQVPKSARMS